MIRSLYIVFIFSLLYFFVFFQIIKVVHSFYLLGNKLTVTVSISIQFSLPPQLEKVNEAVNTLPFQFNKFYAIVNKLLPLFFSSICTVDALKLQLKYDIYMATITMTTVVIATEAQWCEIM